MGNICGKEESETQTPSRVLGSAPPSQRKASVPSPRKVGGPPRTLGGAPAEASADARSKAAEAAQARAKASNQPGGKLQTQLSAQKRQSRNDTLKALSAEEQRAREIAQNEDSRTYD
ncbi:hypothetical protein C2857_002385 [Epichloe festucae Fl1]|uniref:Uncharacterized protein n=1 Tax=Epichloe festucae (strain Fl1) TaxID=877507 RepID=A0A7S9KRW6_EPIFF|nr:hypothetical protein C2857_002385 [Epichloe festucae Fl1]